MAEPQKYKDTTVFIANREQIERARKREQLMRNLARQQLDQDEGQIVHQPSKIIKNIMLAENRPKDPLRIKKQVNFMIELSDSSDSDDDRGRPYESENESENSDAIVQPIIPEKKKKPAKIFVVKPIDEVQESHWKAKKFHLSKEQRNH